MSRLVAVSAVLVVAVTTAAVVLAQGADEGCGKPFDRRAWSAARAAADATRLRELARTLVRCDDLLGRTDAELRAHLGRPTVTNRDGNPRPHREASWRLGSSEGASGTEDVLFVELDRGRAVYASSPDDVERGGRDDLAESGEPVGGGPILSGG